MSYIKSTFNKETYNGKNITGGIQIVTPDGKMHESYVFDDDSKMPDILLTHKDYKNE